MQRLLIALLVACLLTAPSLGVINIRLVAEKTSLVNGESTVVHVLAQGTVAGVFSLAGNIVTTPLSGSPDVLTSTGVMAFDALYNPTGLFTPKPGTPGTNGATGGWTSFGSLQTGWGTPDATLGQADYVEIAHYTVAAVAAPTEGVVRLDFVAAAVGGYKCLEVDKTGVMGTLTPAVISSVPEPMTLTLLALGGLALVRRPR